MYYVVSTDYVGPNQSDDRYLNVDRVDIQTTPERGNSGDHPVILDGWCGTTNDWSVHAHGEHATIEAARAKVAEVTDGKYRDNPELVSDLNQDFFDDVVESYLVGEREKLGAEATTMWCHAITDDVTADTTDADIERMVEECADELRNETGGDADTDALERMLTEARDDAIAERDED